MKAVKHDIIESERMLLFLITRTICPVFTVAHTVAFPTVNVYTPSVLHQFSRTNLVTRQQKKRARNAQEKFSMRTLRCQLLPTSILAGKSAGNLGANATANKISACTKSPTTLQAEEQAWFE